MGITSLILATTVALTSTSAPIYEGTGWMALGPIGSISTDVTYEINFGSVNARTALKPYAEQVAQQMRDTTGINIVVTNDILSTANRTCSNSPVNEITMGYKYQPVGVPGRSVSYTCDPYYALSARGGWLFMDSEYWTCGCNWFYTDPQANQSAISNAVTHEIGHMFGLQDVGLEGDQLQPIMNDTPARGYLNPDNAGDFTHYDITGLNQLVANYDYWT